MKRKNGMSDDDLNARRAAALAGDKYNSRY